MEYKSAFRPVLLKTIFATGAFSLIFALSSQGATIGHTGGAAVTTTNTSSKAVEVAANDAPDSFSLKFDDVNPTDSLGNSVLANGFYTFEGNTVRSRPSNVNVASYNATRITSYQVVALPNSDYSTIRPGRTASAQRSPTAFPVPIPMAMD